MTAQPVERPLTPEQETRKALAIAEAAQVLAEWLDDHPEPVTTTTT